MILMVALWVSELWLMIVIVSKARVWVGPGGFGGCNYTNMRQRLSERNCASGVERTEREWERRTFLLKISPRTEILKHSKKYAKKGGQQKHIKNMKHIINEMRGTWAAQFVKRLTLGFSPGRDLMVLWVRAPHQALLKEIHLKKGNQFCEAT